MNIPPFRASTISIFLFVGLIAFSGAGISAETKKVKADPGKNATWTGEGGMDNFIGTCSPCHGESGKGDGPLADALGEGVKTRDLTDAKYLSAKTDDELFKISNLAGHLWDYHPQCHPSKTHLPMRRSNRLSST